MEYAPYPPQMQVPKSSLSSSPHYSTSPFARDGPVVVGSAGRGGMEKNGGEAITNNDNVLFSEKSKNDRTTPTHASQIQISPFTRDILACINCATTNAQIPTQQQHNQQQQQEESLSRNRKGPIMLELRKVDFIDTDLETLSSSSYDDDQFFTTRTIGLSRGNPSLGTSVASTCLDLPAVKTYSSNQSRIAAATGLTTGMLCIHTFGDTRDDDDGLLSSSIEYFHTPRRQATASSVAWRSTHYNHVAIGLLGGSASVQPQGAGQRRTGGGIRSSGGDREFCCLIWDIERQQSTAKQRSSSPLTKLSHNSPVASLAWMKDGKCYYYYY